MEQKKLVEISITLSAINEALNRISVSGRDNLNNLLGAISVLDKVIVDLKNSLNTKDGDVQ